MYCPDCGLNHHLDDIAAEPEVTVVDNSVSPAEVEIAKITADKEIKLAKIAAGTFKEEMESELESLRAELRGFKEGIDAVAPEPEPVEQPAPVIIDAPDEPVDQLPPPPEDTEEHHERKSKSNMSLGMWS
jgi:hypothetical protein